jgi:TolB protein
MTRSRPDSAAPRPSLPRFAATRSGRVTTLVVLLLGIPVVTRPVQQPVETFEIGGVTPRFAVPDCIPRKADEASQAACRTLTQVLRNDLRFEGLFQFVPDSLVSAIPPLNPDAPSFEDWKGIGAKVLVATRAEVAGQELTVEVRVYFVDTGATMLARRYSGKPDNPRVFAHQASDDIMTLTQYKGVARTRIVFTSDRDATKARRSKELYIVDYDGFNPRRVTVNGSLNILPAWRPDGRALAYVSYRQGSPLIYLAKIFEAQSVPNLSGEKGDAQAFAPSFSPDGASLAFASSRAGNMDVWVARADGRRRPPTRRPAGARPGRRSRSRRAGRARRRSGPWTARASTCAA